MFGIFLKRIFRELKASPFRYISLFLILVFGIYFISVFSISYDTMIVKTNETAKTSNLEDGQFQTFVALSSEQKEEIENTGIILEEQFYYDVDNVDSNPSKCLRAMKIRNLINKIALTDGILPVTSSEVLLEREFAIFNGYKVGSKIKIGEKEYEVVGLGVVPDYNAPFRNLTDPASDPENFSLAFFITDEFNSITYGKSPVLNYAFKLGGNETYDSLKELLIQMKYNYKDVSDPYFIDTIMEKTAQEQKLLDALIQIDDGMSMLNDSTNSIRDVVNGVGSTVSDVMYYIDPLIDIILSVNDQIYVSGSILVSELFPDKSPITLTNNYAQEINALIEETDDIETKVALQNIRENMAVEIGFISPIASNITIIKTIMDTMSSTDLISSEPPLISGLIKLADSINSAYDGVHTLRVRYETELDNGRNNAVHNLISLTKASNNSRILSSTKRASSFRVVVWMMGIVLIILISYVLSVFTNQQLNREVKTIGALYSLGISKGELLKHYILLPTIITTLGSTFGMLLSFIPVRFIDGYSIMESMCSVVPFKMVVLPYLVVSCVILPPVICVGINVLSINKQLSRPALQLLNNANMEQKKKLRNYAFFSKLNFIRMFQFKQLRREAKTGRTIVFGVLNCVILIVLGLSMHFMALNLLKLTKEDTKYDYMYIIKYPNEEVKNIAVDSGGQLCVLKGLESTSFNKKANVSLIGLGDDNKYFPANPEKGYNNVVVSRSLAQKYYLSKGSELILSDSSEEHDYVFYVSGICEYNVGLCVFMNIDSMRKLFGYEDDYFNAALSNKPLEIDSGRIYSIITKEATIKTTGQMIEQTTPMVVMTVIIGFIIMGLVMYILSSVMIDRAAVGISLTSIFGFNDTEIKRMFINFNMITIGISVAVGIPLSLLFSRVLINYSTLNFNMGSNILMPIWAYFILFVAVVGLYYLISLILQNKLKKVSLTEALKSRG